MADVENLWKGGTSDFSEKAVRMAFIRKVYVILGLQLLITTAIVLILSYVDTAKSYVNNNVWVMWTSFALAIVLIIFLVCFADLRRTVPWNYLCLFGFTIAESFLVGSIATMYAPDAVCMAIGICAVYTCLLVLIGPMVVFKRWFAWH
eukprot:m.204969 g.204969  ORF g.204969 m.204969 type:complete len:148 (+) comp39654_c0_seq39:448-891(+)